MSKDLDESRGPVVVWCNPNAAYYEPWKNSFLVREPCACSSPFFFWKTSFFQYFFSDSLYFMVTGVLVSSNNQLRKQWHMSRIGWISISLRCHVGRFFRVSERGRSGCHAGQGCSIFVFNYSGFGRSDGHPSPGQWLIWKISYVFQRAPFNSNANV